MTNVNVGVLDLGVYFQVVEYAKFFVFGALGSAVGVVDYLWLDFWLFHKVS